MISKIKSLYVSYRIFRKPNGQYVMYGFWNATKRHAGKVGEVILFVIAAAVLHVGLVHYHDKPLHNILKSTVAYASDGTNLSFTEKDALQGKIEALQDEVVDYLALHENKNNVPCVPDDNKAHSLPLKDKVSCGVMQFKVSTIQHYYKVLNLGTISDQDAVVLAIDQVRAKGLAKRIIFETPGGINNWTTATSVIKEKVAFIKELM